VSLWNKGQVKLFVREMRKHLGVAWDFMVPEVREAFVAQEAFKVVRANHKVAVDVADMDALLFAMRVEAGLLEDES